MAPPENGRSRPAQAAPAVPTTDPIVPDPARARAERRGRSLALTRARRKSKFDSFDLDNGILAAGPQWFAEKVLARCVPDENGCLVWTGGAIGVGYGAAYLPATVGLRYANGRSAQVLVHRAALVLSLGRPLGAGMESGHICHDRAHAAGFCVATRMTPCQHRRCVNVEHLAEQTHRENVLSGGTVYAANAARTHCLRGHALEGDNLVPSALMRGKRECRTCHRERGLRQGALVGEACRALGLTRREYIATYGQSVTTAKRLLSGKSGVAA